MDGGGWPQGLTPVRVHRMDQGYLCVRPTVRIRREALQGGADGAGAVL